MLRSVQAVVIAQNSLNASSPELEAMFLGGNGLMPAHGACSTHEHSCGVL